MKQVIENALSQEHETILASRGLDVELLARLGVTSVRRGNGEHWISFPYLVNGKVLNRKYRTISGEKRFAQDANVPQRVFYNHECLSDPTLRDEPLIITEGEFDAISAMQAGFLRVVSVPDGAMQPSDAAADERLNGKKFSWMNAYERLLKDVKWIILATDADPPGVALLNDLARRLGKPRCKFVRYPEGCKDLNDVLRAHGSDGVRRCIEGAEFVRVEGVFTLADLPPRPDPRPYDCGLGNIYNHYRVRRGDFCVVSGIPGMGKSAFVTDIACRMARLHGWRICVGSFESWPGTDYRRQLRTWFNGSLEINQSEEEKVRADLWINRHFVFMIPDDDRDVGLDWVEEMISTAAIRHEVKMVILDPWNEIDHLPDPRESMTNYVGYAIRKLKMLARKYDVHLIVVAHPTKMPKRADGTYWVPTLYDIADSAAWANKSDVGIIIHRDDNIRTTVHIQKVKHQDTMGRPGKLEVTFDPATARFYPMDNFSTEATDDA